MSSDIADRLGILRDSCVSKYDRLNDIEIQLRDGEEIIQEKRISFPVESMICNMRVQLTELQLSNALIVEEVDAQTKKNQDLQEKIGITNTDLETQMERHKLLAQKVYHEESILAAHYEHGMDNLNKLYEQYLMSNEELSTFYHLMKDVEQRSKTTHRIEWLKKIIRATQIQQKQDKSCLDHMEKENKKKVNSLHPGKR